MRASLSHSSRPHIHYFLPILLNNILTELFGTFPQVMWWWVWYQSSTKIQFSSVLLLNYFHMALLAIVSRPTSTAFLRRDRKFLSSLIYDHSPPAMLCLMLLYRNLSPFSEPALSESLPMLFLLYEMLFFLKCLVNLSTLSKTPHKCYLFCEGFLTPSCLLCCVREHGIYNLFL